MKKLISLVLVLLLVSFAACATKKEEKVRVKCPACGYEFEAPMGGQ